MRDGLLIIDVQRDFTSRIAGGPAVAAAITAHLREHRADYAHVVASRDWHDAVGDNGGHFPPSPPGSADPFVRHCVAGSLGAEYDPALDVTAVDAHVRKGQGVPGYSIFTGITDEGRPFPEHLDAQGLDRVDVVGLATDYCVRAAALDARAAGLEVRMLLPLCAGTDRERVDRALAELREAGVQLV